MVCHVNYGFAYLASKSYELYLCAGRAVANMVGSVQHGLPVEHTHSISKQGRFSIALIFWALVTPVDQPFIPGRHPPALSQWVSITYPKVCTYKAGVSINMLAKNSDAQVDAAHRTCGHATIPGQQQLAIRMCWQKCCRLL